MAARIRKGDTVVVISGKDKGRTGKVKQVLRDSDRVVVEGINLVKRHMRPTPRNPSGGILERFPELRLGLLEGNCSWAPFMMYRLDEHWEWTGKYEAPDVLMKPSEYMLRNCYLSVEADEEPAKYYFEEYGDDNVVYSTDYPHADSKFPGATDCFMSMPFDDTTKKKVLWDNYQKLYHVPVPAPAENGGR